MNEHSHRRFFPALLMAPFLLQVGCARFGGQGGYIGYILLNSSAATSSQASASTTTASVKHVFVTTGTTNGLIGGVGGFASADTFCNADAGKPSGGGTYKSMIVDAVSRIACTNCFSCSVRSGWMSSLPQYVPSKIRVSRRG